MNSNPVSKQRNDSRLVVRLVNSLVKWQARGTHNIRGSLRGNGLVPPQGVSEAPRGELDSPLEVCRLSGIVNKNFYEAGY